VKQRLIAIAVLGVLAVISLPVLQMFLPSYPRYGKGGVGFVSSSVYVLTKATRNQVFEVASHQPLFSGDMAKFELKLLKAKNTSAPVLVLFTQEAIYFYEFDRFKGGNYLRGNDH
jgi:hypothetical protein